jgi:hypothetical protein
LEYPVLVAKEDKYLISAATCKAERRPTVVWRLNWKDQIGDQKLKELLRCEAHIAMGGRDPRSLSKEKGNAASQLRLAPNHWALATMQHPRSGKIMTSKRRRLPNRRSCFLFRIEGYEKPLNHLPN